MNNKELLNTDNYNQQIKEDIIKNNDSVMLTTHLDFLKLKHFKLCLEKNKTDLNPTEQNLFYKSLKTYLEFEVAERQSNNIKAKIKAANFLRLQTVDQFDFTYNASTQKIKKNYLMLLNKALKGECPNAIFVGSAGLGKTHLARSLGFAACQGGLSVLFVNVAEMVNKLSVAKITHNLDLKLKKYRKPTLLILDEFGYVNMNLEESNLFFQVISSRHDLNLGTIITTNHSFGQWNQILASDAMAHIVIDRLTAPSEIFHLEGSSYRAFLKSKKR